MRDILKTGHQPIHNEGKTIRIVFNSKNYNFNESDPGRMNRPGRKKKGGGIF